MVRGAPRLRWGAALKACVALRPGVSDRVLTRTVGILFGVGGAGLVAVVLALDAPGSSWVFWVVDVVCLVAGAWLLLFSRHVPLFVFRYTQLAALVLHAAFVMAMDQDPQEVAWTSLLAVVVAVSALVFTPVAALVHLALAIASIIMITTVNPVGLGTQIILVGLCVLTAGLVAGLANARESAEADTLTGLMNRRGFTRLLRELTSRGPRREQQLTLALVDLDHFKVINDSQGHAAGDEVLREVAAAWVGRLGSAAVLGRWGGDEFALLVHGDQDCAEALIADLRAQLRQGLSCTAGMVRVDGGESPQELLDRADAALYEAKRSQRSTTRRWSATTLTTKNLLRGIGAGQIEVHHQPVIALGSGEIVGSEALVRWRREGQLLAPGLWLPLAEGAGAAVALGRFALEQACVHAAGWPVVAGRSPLSVAVNASGVELADQGYARHVLQTLFQTGLAPERLVVEVVEDALVEESATVSGNVGMLRRAGVRIAIDDFGTGMSSLRRLTRLPVDIVKVDRCFTAEIKDVGSKAPVLSAMLGLAEQLGLAVVVEGVESAEQAAWLRGSSCREAQGFLWSPAVPVQAFEALVAGQHCEVPEIPEVARA